MTSAALLGILPELVLVIGATLVLMYGVFAGANQTRMAMLLSAGVLAITLLVQVFMAPADGLYLSDMVRVSAFSGLMKTLILLGSLATLALSYRYIYRVGMDKFEYPVLIMFATVGMMMMVSANDLMSLYMGLELQSLALYVVAAFRRDTLRSSEAGLKYFVLGALSSGLLLFGASLVYGFVGSTNFAVLAAALSGVDTPAIGLLFGLSFIAAGLAFKISAVPFHMWTPDVYEGAPMPVTAFFASAPKVAAMGLFLTVMMGPFAPLADQWRQIIVFVALASMVLGALAAINQTKIKRLMAYSSIGHMGFALVGLAAGTQEGVEGVIVYMAIYMVMTLGAFGVLLALEKDERAISAISELSGLGRSHPMHAAALAIFMFSMAGIPPLAGFFGKLYVFMAAYNAGLFSLVIIGLLTSVVSTFYYIRIVKVMYFDETDEGLVKVGGIETSFVIAVAGVAVLAFIAFQGLLLSPSGRAAAALVGS